MLFIANFIFNIFNVSLSNNIHYSSLKLIHNGFDYLSLTGSNIIYNDDYILVSSNGYDIFNGLVSVFNNDLKNNKLEKHSIIYAPNKLSNSNFGSFISINSNNVIAISAIGHNIYEGIVYVYHLHENKNHWILTQTIYSNELINDIPINNFTKPIVFGKNLALDNNYLIIGTNSEYIIIYKYNLKKKLFEKNYILTNSKFNKFYKMKLFEINEKKLLFISSPSQNISNNLHNTISIYDLDKN